MERLLGWKFWTYTIGGYLITALSFEQVISTRWGVAVPDWLNKFLPQVLGLLIGIFFLKPVWRRVWQYPIIGPWFSRNVFPDLNGEWDVEMFSNFPRIEAMKNAAKDASLARYDADKDYENVKLMPVKTFEKAVIDQNWGGVTMTLHPKPNSSDPGAKAEDSVTIAFDLLRDGAGRPQIAYVFVQKNKLNNLASTDVPEFLGAAVLTVNEGATQLQGTYFNARSLAKGFNTAGKLTLTKRPEKSAQDAPSPRKEDDSTLSQN
jgi:hypothetical protein